MYLSLLLKQTRIPDSIILLQIKKCTIEIYLAIPVSYRLLYVIILYNRIIIIMGSMMISCYFGDIICTISVQ